MKESKKNMEVMNGKIDAIDQKQKNCETKTVNEIAAIRNEIQENNSTMQETITANILTQMKPEMTKMQEQFVTNDLEKIV